MKKNHKEKKSSAETVKFKIRKPTFSTLVLVVGIIFFLISGIIFFSRGNFQGEDYKEVLTEEEIQEKAQEGVEFINKNLLSEGGADMAANLIEASKENGLIKMTIDINGEQFDSYLTKDGEKLFPEAIEMGESFTIDSPAETPQPEAQQADYSKEEIEEFVDCLEENDFVIYGAEWCPYCKELTDRFGGYEAVDPIYIECTEEKELCEQRGIEGYPTIRLGGEEFPGGRSFSEFARYTECNAPVPN